MQEDPVLNAPIRSLQLMLRTLSFLDEDLPAIVPDGIFGAATAGAVSAFQQKNGLPVTGIADDRTHAAIVRAYNAALPALLPAEAPISLFPSALVIAPGQSHPHVFVAQGILAALHGEYPQFPMPDLTGRIDEKTEEGLRMLQSLSQSSPTGSLDSGTYRQLAQLYRGSVRRDLEPGCG